MRANIQHTILRRSVRYYLSSVAKIGLYCGLLVVHLTICSTLRSNFLEIRVWVFPRSRVPFQGDDTDYRARRHIPTGGFPNPIMFAPQLGAEIQPVHLVFHCENFELRGVGSSKTTKVFHLHQPCL
jgi:hypothetical protein